MRDVVQELLPNTLSNELFADLQKQVHGRLDLIFKEVRESLGKMDERSKSVQDYIVRQVELAQVKTTEAAPELAPKSE